MAESKLSDFRRQERITISTTLPIEIYRKIKEEGQHFNDLILIGYRHRAAFDELKLRIKDLEEDSNKAKEKIRQLALRNNELQVDMMKLEKKNGVQ